MLSYEIKKCLVGVKSTLFFEPSLLLDKAIKLAGLESKHHNDFSLEEMLLIKEIYEELLKIIQEHEEM